MYPESPAKVALSVEGVKSAHFFASQIDSDLFAGVVFSKTAATEFDVRQTEDGWNVNDDLGRDFADPDLRIALRKAITANEPS